MMPHPAWLRRWRTLACLLLALALVACRDAGEVGIDTVTPEPGIDAPLDATPTAVPALAEARPSPVTASPSATPAQAPTPAPSPTASAPPPPSPTPSPVRTPAPSPTPTPTATPQPPPTMDPCTAEAARRRVGASIVQVVNDRGGGRTTAASGFAVAGEQILTNEHVVNGAVALAVLLPDGRRLPARLLRADEGRDLALLEAPGAALPAVRFAVTGTVPGQPLLALGFPVSAPSADPSLAAGALLGSATIGGATFLRTDLPASVGYSGGPLLTPCGEVVGAVTSGFTGPAGVTFAVARGEIDAFLAGAPPLRPGGPVLPPAPTSVPAPLTTPRPSPAALPSAAATPVPSVRPAPGAASNAPTPTR